MNRIVSYALFLLAAVVAAYGVIIMLVRSGSPFFMVWFGIGLLLFLAAIVFRKGLWKRLTKKIRLLISGCLLLGAVVIVITQMMVLSGFGWKGEKDLDYIIVPGSLARKDGSAAITRYRLDEAIDYLNENPGTKVRNLKEIT